MRWRQRSSDVATILAMLLLLACATLQPDPGDQPFRRRAEMVRPVFSGDQPNAITFAIGPYAVEKLQLRSAARRFAFQLETPGARVVLVQCRVGPHEGSVELLSHDGGTDALTCDFDLRPSLEPASWSLELAPPRAEGGVRSGLLRATKPLFEIRSVHLRSSAKGRAGPLVGFQIRARDRAIGEVQTAGDLALWIDVELEPSLRPLAAACAIALFFYERSLAAV